MSENIFKHVGGVLQNVRIPIPDYLEAAVVEYFCSFCVRLRIFNVLASVQLNNEPGIHTGKVGYEPVNGKLTTKLPATELPIPETLPKPRFRFRCPSAQRLCA